MAVTKKDIYKTISKKLKELRDYYNLSQQEFGEKIGTSGQNVYRYENGVVNLPVDVLLNIMDNFNVPLEYFTNERVNPGEIDLKKRISTEYSSPIIITSEEEKNYTDRRKFTAVPIIESYEVRKAEETATSIKSAVKDYIFIPQVTLEEGEDLFAYEVKDYSSFPEVFYGDIVVVKLFKEDPVKKLSPKFYIQPDTYQPLNIIRIIMGSDLAFTVRRITVTSREYVCYSGVNQIVLRKNSSIEQPVGSVLSIHRLKSSDKLTDNILHLSMRYRDIV